MKGHLGWIQEFILCFEKVLSRRNKMNRLKNLLGVFAFALLVLGLPSLASAQWGNNNDYGRNRNQNQGNYYNNDLRNAIKQLKDQSRNFARQVDRELDRSRIDGTNREDRINDIANDFKNAADRLNNRFGNGRNYNSTSDEAAQVISLGRRLERSLGRARLSYGMQNSWNQIQRNLNIISSYYRNNDNWNRGRGN